MCTDGIRCRILIERFSSDFARNTRLPCYTYGGALRQRAGAISDVAKRRPWPDFGGGIARSGRDLNVYEVRWWASGLREARETESYPVTRKEGLWGCAFLLPAIRKIRCREKETVTRSGGWNCKFPPRSSYLWGQMLGQPLRSSKEHTFPVFKSWDHR